MKAGGGTPVLDQSTIAPVGGVGQVGPVAAGRAVPEEVPLPNPVDIRKRYGPQAWDWYLDTGADQGWRCGICRRPPRRAEPLVVDHDHDTLVLDGLVHKHGCNRLLKQPVRRYLADPPGRRRGVLRVPAEREERAVAKREREKAAARTRRAGGPKPRMSTSSTVGERIADIAG